MITVEDVDFAYDGRLVLKKISFQVTEGSFVALFGPNGGGKTTLLSLLLGFNKPLNGTISVEGSLAYVPQNFVFDPLFPISTYEVVALANKHNASSALKMVGMEKERYTPFAALSGGQRQRVLIARALAMDPQILLLDEPVANVDPKAQVGIYNILRSLKGKMTIVMVTHDLQGALDLADHLLCVQQTLHEIQHDQLCHHFSHGLYHAERT